MTTMLASLLFLSLACSATPEPVDQPAFVAAYFRSVLADDAMSARDFKRRLGSETALVEPIGWTASGRSFANVVSGFIEKETRVLVVAPSQTGLPRRSGRLTIEIHRIRSLDLPEYFDFIREPRPGFSSTENDRIFLDLRRETDPLLQEETIEHEIMHLLDRPHLSRLSPAELEERAMIRGLARGRIPVVNRDRLYAAARGTGHYRAAAERLLGAFALVLTDGDPEALREIEPEQWTWAARILEVLLGL